MHERIKSITLLVVLLAVACVNRGSLGTRAEEMSLVEPILSGQQMGLQAFNLTSSDRFINLWRRDSESAPRAVAAFRLPGTDVDWRIEDEPGHFKALAADHPDTEYTLSLEGEVPADATWLRAMPTTWIILHINPDGQLRVEADAARRLAE